MTNIKRIRMQRLLSQKELATMCGISQQRICGYEKGKHKMSIVSAHKIAKALNVTIDDLIGAGTDEEG